MSHLPMRSSILASETIIIPLLGTPFTLCLGIERLPGRLKLLIVPSNFTLDVFYLFNSRGTHMLIHGLIPGYYPYSILSFPIYPVTYS